MELTQSTVKIIKDELENVVEIDDRTVSNYISRQFYASVAISRSIFNATDSEWLPLGWNSLFEGFISDFKTLPVTGVSIDQAQAFCNAIGGELSDFSICNLIFDRYLQKLSDQEKGELFEVSNAMKRRMLEEQYIGGKYAARMEYYLRVFSNDLIYGEFMKQLPLLFDELALVVPGSVDIVEKFSLLRMFDGEMKSQIGYIYDASVAYNASFRCIWTSSQLGDIMDQLV